MVDIERRHAELFRLRLGERLADGSPRALHGRMRVTAVSRQVVDAFASTYGGVTSQWGEAWQCYLDRSDLPVLVLPGQSCEQWWEQWKHRVGSMPVCTHRCDGLVNHKTGEACTCPAPDERGGPGTCQPTTRLWVLCPEVPVLGAGRLETHGMIAAQTLPQAVAVLQAAMRQGELLPATLRVRLVESSGRRYVVPTLEVTGLSWTEAAGQAAAMPDADATAPVSEHSTAPGPSEAQDGPAPLALTGPGPSAPSHPAGRGVRAPIRDVNRLRLFFARRGVTDEEQIAERVSAVLGRQVRRLSDLDADEMASVVAALEEKP